MTKVIIFDCYKTLIHVENDEENLQTYKFLSAWLSYHGLKVKPKALRTLYRQTVKQEIKANPEPYPDVNIGHVFAEVLAAISKTEPNRPAASINELSLLFRMLTTTTLAIYPETRPVLQSLSKQPVRLALVSNTQRLFTLPELRKFDIEKFFECIIFSSDVKAAKPNPKVFSTLLETMKIEPQQAIFVGDNLFDDIWGAQAIGMKTIWLKREPQVDFPEGIERPSPDLIIKDNFSIALYPGILSLI